MRLAEQVVKAIETVISVMTVNMLSAWCRSGYVALLAARIRALGGLSILPHLLTWIEVVGELWRGVGL